MSEQIDWSKAPDSAMVLLKHVRDGAYAVAESYSDEAKTWSWPDPRYSFHLMPGMWRVVAERLSTPSWSGEGLPPVGVVCRIITNNSAWWKYSGLTDGEDVTVCHSFKNSKGCDMVVVEACNGACLAVTVECVAPIRTPKQIAADERDAAIRSMLSGFDSARSWLVSDLAGFIYDKGFRKQDGK